MQFAVDHQHRTGLGRKDAAGAVVEKGQRLEHVGAAGPDAENAIGQQPEIAGACIRDHVHQFDPVFHVVAHRRTVAVIHSAVHGEYQALPLLRQGGIHLAELSEDAPGSVVEKQPQVGGFGIDHADGITVILELDFAAFDRSLGRSRPAEAGRKCNRQGTDHWSRSRRTAS